MSNPDDRREIVCSDEPKSQKDRKTESSEVSAGQNVPYLSTEEYVVRIYPEPEENRYTERRISVPINPDNPNAGIFHGRRHSEVILSPSDAFRRDYFKFPSNPFSKVNEYVSDVLHKLHRRFRSQDELGSSDTAELKLDLPNAKSKWKKGVMSEEDNYTRHLNPLEVSDNGNEAVSVGGDDFLDADEEIGRPNSHSTPKHSAHDTLFIASEDGRSSRRNSDDVEVRGKHKMPRQMSEASTRTEETILNPASLRGSPEENYEKRSPEKSAMRQCSIPNSPRRMRRRSVEFKMQTTHSDETLNR